MTDRSTLLKSTYVIIGGGIAGVSCCEQLAVEDPDESVVLVSSSPLVKAAKNVKRLTERSEEFDVEEETYTSLEKRHPNCKVIAGTATKINDRNHELHLSSGIIIQYEKLCICTGAVPKVISTGNPKILGIRDTETVEIFQKKISNAKRVVIVGNGGIATELAYEIENCEVIWAIKDKSIGSTFFDSGAANFFLPSLNESKKNEPPLCTRKKYKVDEKANCQPETVMGSALGPDWSIQINLKGKSMETHRVHLEYECEVKEIFEGDRFDTKRLSESESSEDSWPVYVELTSGKIYGCDFVISATGVIPNTTLNCENKFTIAEDGGIVVNDQMKTNLDGIFAAGDVCTASWPHSDNWFQMRLWTQARQMGAFAAKCMAAEIRGEKVWLDICFDLFTHVTRFFGYKVVLLGLYNGQKLGTDYEVIVRPSERTEYVKVILQGGKMRGAILIGDTDLEETFENLILNCLDLSAYGEDILNPNVDIDDYFD